MTIKARDAIVATIHFAPDFSKATVKSTNRIYPDTVRGGIERERKLTKREQRWLDKAMDAAVNGWEL